MSALRATAIAAQLLCDELLSVYRREQVPRMIEDFASADFTRRSLIDPKPIGCSQEGFPLSSAE